MPVGCYKQQTKDSQLKNHEAKALTTVPNQKCNILK